MCGWLCSAGRRFSVPACPTMAPCSRPSTPLRAASRRGLRPVLTAAARGALPKSGRAAHALTAGLPRKAYRLRRRPRSPKAILASLLASATVTARLSAFSAARHLSALPEAPAPKVIQRQRRFARLRGRPRPSRRPRDNGAEVPGWSKLLPAGIVTAAQIPAGAPHRACRFRIGAEVPCTTEIGRDLQQQA